jgi:hypothetical protein
MMELNVRGSAPGPIYRRGPARAWVATLIHSNAAFHRTLNVTFQ